MPDYIAPPEKIPTGSTVWAYLRDSGGEAQEQSVAQQRAEVDAYCHRNGLFLIRMFADVAKSGGSVVGREAFHDMIDASENPQQRPAGLLLWNFARFARDLDDSSYFKSLLRKRGLVVHSLTDPIPSGQYGRVIETLIDISNEEKRRQTSRDVRRGLASLVSKGYSAGGFPPRGYKAVKVEIGLKRNGQPRTVSKWVPDPKLWDLVKLAWQMRADGRSYQDIQKATEGKLYKTKNSWTTFFLNKTYLGIGKAGNLEIPDHHEAAITLEIWEAVQRHREAAPRVGKPSSTYYHPRRKGSPSLLSGLAFCIHCGAALTHHKGHKKHRWPYYICGKKDREKGLKTCEARLIGAPKAEKAILDAVFNRILSPAYVEDLLEDIAAQLSSIDVQAVESEIAEFQEKQALIDQQIANLLDAVENNGVAAALDRLKQREAERGQILTEIKSLEAKRESAIVSLSPETLALVLDTWREKFLELREDNDIPALRSHLTRFVSKIELGYQEAKIWYTFPLDSNPPYNVFPCGGT